MTRGHNYSRHLLSSMAAYGGPKTTGPFPARSSHLRISRFLLKTMYLLKQTSPNGLWYCLAPSYCTFEMEVMAPSENVHGSTIVQKA